MAEKKFVRSKFRVDIEYRKFFTIVIDQDSFQIIATAVFCFLIAHITDKRNAYPHWLQPLLIGLSFFAVGTAFAYNCGYPCNPARDFGPRLFSWIVGYGGDVFS
ncbi:unnamed protein product [Strongylus vulgaris]|uniref:Aquaporin n=1 Tax=Strongylus vulgaris TaxID=40348 RepID=A0A3P7LPR6_STRVU|nr:unnamed protein product [Strongylus vulgaris]